MVVSLRTLSFAVLVETQSVKVKSIYLRDFEHISYSYFDVILPNDTLINRIRVLNGDVYFCLSCIHLVPTKLRRWDKHGCPSMFEVTKNFDKNSNLQGVSKLKYLSLQSYLNLTTRYDLLIKVKAIHFAENISFLESKFNLQFHNCRINLSPLCRVVRNVYLYSPNCRFCRPCFSLYATTDNELHHSCWSE